MLVAHETDAIRRDTCEIDYNYYYYYHVRVQVFAVDMIEYRSHRTCIRHPLARSRRNLEPGAPNYSGSAIRVLVACIFKCVRFASEVFRHTPLLLPLIHTSWRWALFINCNRCWRARASALDLLWFDGRTDG